MITWSDIISVVQLCVSCILGILIYIGFLFAFRGFREGKGDIDTIMGFIGILIVILSVTILLFVSGLAVFT